MWPRRVWAGIALSCAVLSLCHLVAATGAVPPATQPAPAAVLCPATDRPVDREICERFRGRWLYFATDEARQQFLADPSKFADGLARQWSTDIPLRVQVACPVTGEPIDPAIFVGRGLKAVYFASAAARSEWERDSLRFLERLDRDCYTFQTRCAACNNLIVPGARRTIDGRALYFCCTGCPRGCERDRAACLKRVDEQIAANQAAFVRERGDLPRPAGAGPSTQSAGAAASTQPGAAPRQP
jgi:hypothetical protein